MSQSKSSEKFDGSPKSIFLNMTAYNEAVKTYFVVVASFLVVFTYNSFDLVYNHWELIEDATTEDEWYLTFNEQSENLQESRVLQDGEMQTFTFYIDDVNVPDGYLIGEINITVDDTGNDGLIANTDPTNECDSILADVREGGLTAQWADENNTLSGQTNDCQPFFMYLRVYPDYDGLSRSSDSVNEFQALLPWQQSGWGYGELEIDVEVNTDDSIFPGQSSDDEEITITIEVIMFEISASKVI